MSKINIGLSKNPSIKNVEIDKDFKDITFSEIQEIVKLFYPDGDTVIGWSESPEKTKVTLK